MLSTTHDAKAHDTKDTKDSRQLPQVVSTNFRAKVMDLETDGKTIFLEVDLTDGLTTLKLEPHLPRSTGPDAIVAYLKELVEKHPTLSPELSDLIGLTVQFDPEDDTWYELRAGSKRKRLQSKEGKDSEKAEKSEKVK